MNKNLSSFLTLLTVFVLPAFVVYLMVQFSIRRLDPIEVNVPLKADHIPSVDHTQFEILQQDFKKPQDVTAACLSCHNKRGEEVMATAHWTWERKTEIPGKGEVTIGKNNLINNFCTGAVGNNGSCMRCHIGYGWSDKDFDFGDQRNIDCLVCHDQSGTYIKRKGGAGMPSTPENANEEFPVPDYNLVAQSVGYPMKHNCGVCHFEGGGGNNVKHGDLEMALLNTTRKVDVHMAAEGKNMECVDCHKADKHNILGRAYSVSSTNDNRIGCTECHTERPHQDKILDDHFRKIACQTCHIPQFAKVNPTLMYWDWSKGGRVDDNGDFIVEYDDDHKYSYLTIKGRFIWDKNVIPDYVWFNGTADHFLYTDTISEEPVKINELFGHASCSDSKIWPIKVHKGKQPYDTEYKTLASVKLWASGKGQGAFWEDADWGTAIRLGMEYTERPYSGNFDFISTIAYWPINHMVSPKEDALSCNDCHKRDGGRLAGLNGFYLPGRDYSKTVEYGGFTFIILSLLGVVIHASARFISRKKLSSKTE
jgi:octaheme c-type cytochrome (tetrathionate reductase family)